MKIIVVFLFCFLFVSYGCGPKDCDEFYTLTLYSCTNAKYDFFGNIIVCTGKNRFQTLDSRTSDFPNLIYDGCTIAANGNHYFDDGIQTKICK